MKWNEMKWNEMKWNENIIYRMLSGKKGTGSSQHIQINAHAPKKKKVKNRDQNFWIKQDLVRNTIYNYFYVTCVYSRIHLFNLFFVLSLLQLFNTVQILFNLLLYSPHVKTQRGVWNYFFNRLCNFCSYSRRQPRQCNCLQKPWSFCFDHLLIKTLCRG